MNEMRRGNGWRINRSEFATVYSIASDGKDRIFGYEDEQKMWYVGKFTVLRRT